jgi:preprotein translocase SecE subunit
MIGSIYKPGQGYWTRLMSIIGLSLLVLMGVAWLWKLLANAEIGTLQPIYVQAGAAVIVLLVCTWLGYWLFGVNQRVVEFTIATESEMKKVNWSTRREILGSTWIVIALTFFIALLCFGFDTVYHIFFQSIRVLESGT